MNTIYAVLKAYDKNDKIYYQILPYSLTGTIKSEFYCGKGLKSLIPFLKKCRFTEKRANKLKIKLENIK